jgi:hypothetical protein
MKFSQSFRQVVNFVKIQTPLGDQIRFFELSYALFYYQWLS